MIFVTSLFILVKLSSVEPVFYPNGNCDFSLTVYPTQLYAFNNPHFPNTYPPGITCRWVFDCLPEYTCRIDCQTVGLPKTQSCFMDRLLVSITGNLFFEGAQVFCGRTIINASSISTRITMGLVSHPMSVGGRFRCHVRAEAWTHPFSRGTDNVNVTALDEELNTHVRR